MTSTPQRIEGRGDAELIAAVRGGETAAYGVLFERHVDAARRLARQLVRGPDSDDLVSEAFAKVMVVLQRGGGPDLAFRAYLLTAVRRLHVDRVRHGRRVRPTDDLAAFDAGVPFRDPAVEGFESDAAARAFASLPERWQLVLWHTEVEGQKPAEVAPLLDMSPNSVSALAYRAREGLRQAFLSLHAGEPDDDACGWTRSHLGGYIRGGVARRDSIAVQAHLAQCRPCAAVLLELTEVNDQLSGLLAPALLGPAATAYVAASSSAGAGISGGVLVALLDRAKDLVGAHAITSSVAGAAATAVIGGAVVVADPPTAEQSPRADPPAQVAPAPQPPLADLDRRGPRRHTEVDRPSPTPPPAPTPTPQSPPARPELLDGPAPAPAPPPAGRPPGHPAPHQDAGAEGLGLQTQPSPGQYDVALEATATRSGRGVTRIVVTVSGLPAGGRAILTSRGSGLVVALAPDRRCLPTALHTSRCTVDGDRASYRFLAHAPQSGSMDFELTVEGGGTDTDPTDNRVSVPIV